jgi:DNA-binding NarL/FixJ family response regulator
MEPNILGAEPEWVKEKRRADMLNYTNIKERFWTKEEDQRLKAMVESHCYTYPEISRVLKRTELSIQKRLVELGIKARPVALDKNKWTEEETKILIDLYKKGYGLNTIAERLGKSSNACRNKLYRILGAVRDREDGQAS